MIAAQVPTVESVLSLGAIQASADMVTKATALMNLSAALVRARAWVEGSPRQQVRVRTHIGAWLQEGRALTSPVTVAHVDAALNALRECPPTAVEGAPAALPRSRALDGPHDCVPQFTLTVQDERHVYGGEKTPPGLGLREVRAQEWDELVLDASKLNQSLSLFRSLDALHAQLDGLTCASDAEEEPPESPLRAEPLAIACGVRGLAVPLIPRAPGSRPPDLGMMTRDDCGTGAPTGGATAA